MLCIQPFLLLAVGLFNLLNRIGKNSGFRPVFHLRDLFFHFNDHTTSISPGPSPVA